MHHVPKDVQRRVLVRRRRNERNGCRKWWCLFCRILLPWGRDDSSWRWDGWRLSFRIVLHCGWCNLNDVCVHAVSRGVLRRCYNADDRSVLWRVHSRILLPHRLRLRQRRSECWHMHHVPKDV